MAFERKQALGTFGDVFFRSLQGFSGNTNHFLVRAAPGRRRKASGEFRDVEPDDGEVAVCEFEDVGATVKRNGLYAVGVRVRSKAAKKMWRSHLVIEFRNQGSRIGRPADP